MINKLKRLLRKRLLGYDVSTYFFSQAGEDQIAYSALSEVIRCQKKGFYVDVGAYHPTQQSNTFLFYKLGWRGINIDAGKDSMKIFQKVRPKDINLEMGVGLNEGSLEYNEVSSLGLMNSFSKSNLKRLRQTKHIQKSYPVQIKRLSTILDEYCPKNTVIDLLSVDVEGMDLEVLKSNNWDKYYPRLVIAEVEGTTMEECLRTEIQHFLNGLDYSVVGKTLVTNGVSSLIFRSNQDLN
jgi:FkbM family methyltransferase